MESLAQPLLPKDKREKTITLCLVIAEAAVIIGVFYFIFKPKKIEAVKSPEKEVVAKRENAHVMTLEEQREFDALSKEVDEIQKDLDSKIEPKLLRMVELQFGIAPVKPPAGSPSLKLPTTLPPSRRDP